jgi:hypothetical protein
MKSYVATIVAAECLPYDLAAYREVYKYRCTYRIVDPSMWAIAKTIFGFAELLGRLPVTIHRL